MMIPDKTESTLAAAPLSWGHDSGPGDARLRFVLDAARAGFWEFDPASGALYCSPGGAPLLAQPGRAGRWSLARQLTRIHAEDRARVRSTLAAVPGATRDWQFECRLLAPDRSVRWISVNGQVRNQAGRVQGIVQDITERKRTEAIARGQQQALELAMTGAPLSVILNVLTRSAEEQAGGSIHTAVLLLDPDGTHLRLGAGPSLPQAYNRAVDGLPIGPSAGSCGTAAFFGAPVIVSDIERDPRWCDYRHLALAHGLRACWSLPILSIKGKVLGTVACYCREVREPTPLESKSIALLVNTAALVIERDREGKERRAAEQALRASEERFRTLVDATSSVVWTTSPTVEFVAAQPGWAAFTGQSSEEMRGLGWLQAIHPEDRAQAAARRARMQQQGETVYAEYRLRRADGQYRHVNMHAVPIFDAYGSLREWAWIFTDVTESRQAEQRLQHLAQHDTLTGLPNRVYLNEHLQALIDAGPKAQRFAVMLIDLDRFKQVNDSLGHESGDAMLRQVAQRLEAALPPGDLVARLGGDEFVVVARLEEDEQAARDIADALMQAIASPINIPGTQLFSGASIGISLYPAHGGSKEVLIQHADIAMYRAKAAGGRGYQLFCAEMSIETKQRMALELALRGALEKGEFVLHYQPRLRLPDLQVRGVEALIRWHHPERGVISPMDFVPIAEETGLIDAIGLWVLDQACRDIGALGTRLGRPIQVSVNMAPRQLKSPQLVTQIAQALKRHALDPACLELELTEGAFIDDMEASAQVMRQLKALGVQLAVDDFGTGYSGLSYLRRFPIDTVKLDRTFVTPPDEGLERYDFIKAITDMAHALDLYVVAEGVEDGETLDLLRQAQCDEAQGYLFARPLPLETLVAYLMASTSAVPEV